MNKEFFVSDEITQKIYKFDSIIYATGFDAITGSFDRIDIRGLRGTKLKEQWAFNLETVP